MELLLNKMIGILGDAFKRRRNDDDDLVQYIFEPEVGAGRIYFKLGFDQKPIRLDGNDAVEGETRM